MKMFHRYQSLGMLLLISSLTCGVYAVSIDCGEFYVDDTLSRVWGYTYYSCNGTVSANESNNDVIELLGMHKYGTNNSYVERVVLEEQNLTSFPASLENLFPHLRHIILSFNSITRITSGHLKPHKYLNILNMDHNQITSLESDLFDGLDSLFLINFDNNFIAHIGFDIKLPSQVHLRKNTCIDVELSHTEVTDFLIAYIQNFSRNGCLPLQPIARLTSNISESTNFEEKPSIFLDHTQQKEEPEHLKYNI